MIEQFYKDLTSIEGFTVDKVFYDKDEQEVQVQFSNGNGVSINMVLNVEGCFVSDPYSPCHLCCERGFEHGDEFYEDEDPEDLAYECGFEDGFAKGVEAAQKNKRK